MSETLVGLYERKNWISLSSCQHGFLYYIHARNTNAGIFDATKQGFVISRKKFSANYLFIEYHWDTGEPLGTVKPLRKLCEAPPFKNNEDKLAWLNTRSAELPDPWTDLETDTD